MRKVIVPLLALLAAACAPLRAYRNNNPLPPSETISDGTHDITVSYVEFDDHGLFWTDDQLPNALRNVKAAQSPNGALVAVFVHGWENNASKDNGDVASFKQKVLIPLSLRETRLAVEQGRPRRNVAGVFLGWRGLSVTFTPLFWTSFADRENAADRVADTHATSTIRSLVRTVREDRRNGSQIIVIGHSFGGRITEKALGPELVSEAARARVAEIVRDAAAIRSEAADITILENQAANATEALGDIWYLKDVEFFAARKPIFISVTSATDYATGLAFPAGNFLTSIFERFRNFNGTRVEQANVGGERAVYIRTVGHISQLYSHDLRYTKVAQSKGDPAAPVERCGAPTQRSICFTVDGDHFEISERAHAWNDTPYWVMQVPKTVINGHSDVWNDVWVHMLMGLLETTALNGPAEEPRPVRAR